MFKKIVSIIKAKLAEEKAKLEIAESYVLSTSLGSRLMKRRYGSGAFMGMVVGVISFIIVAIAIVIGYIILSATTNTASTAAGSTGLTSSQSSQLASISSSVNGAFVLLTVLPIVLAASLIIAALFLFGGYGAGGQGGERVA